MDRQLTLVIGSNSGKKVADISRRQMHLSFVCYDYDSYYNGGIFKLLSYNL